MIVALFASISELIPHHFPTYVTTGTITNKDPTPTHNQKATKNELPKVNETCPFWRDPKCTTVIVVLSRNIATLWRADK